MIPHFISAMLGTILGLKRVCPRCQRTQIVSSELKHSVVPCKFCGAEVPPKRPDR